MFRFTRVTTTATTWKLKSAASPQIYAQWKQLFEGQSSRFEFASSQTQNPGSGQSDQNQKKKIEESIEAMRKLDQEMSKRMKEMEMKRQSGVNNGNSSTSSFDERKFTTQFQSIFSNYNLKKEDQAVQLIESMKPHLDQVQRLETLVNLLDKSTKFNIYLSKEFETRVLDRGLLLIGISPSTKQQTTTTATTPSYQLKSDGGDLIRALTLVAGLKKIRYMQFYAAILGFLEKNGENFSLKNILTISETICYNKLIQALPNGKQGLINVLDIVLKKVSPSEVDILPALMNLMCYIQKNERQFDQNCAQKCESIVKVVHQCLFGVLADTSTASTESLIDIFLIAEIQNHLEIYARLSKSGDIGFIQRKFNNLFGAFVMRNFASKTYYDYEKVLRYVKKFLAAPPVGLNPQVLRLIHSTFATVQPKNLNELTPFLYFLSKTIEKYKLPFESAKTIEETLQQEKNIMILSKLMEIYSTTQYQNSNAIASLEKRIIDLSKMSANPTAALLILLQSLANLKAGSTETIIYLIDYFKYPGVLEKIDFFDLIIKLIPSLGIKTKEYFKQSTNMAFQTGSNILEDGITVDPQLQQSLEGLWDKLEALVTSKIDEVFYDKYPTLLMHFLYANLMKNKYRRIFNVLSQRIVHYIPSYNPKQISELIYCYARMHEKNLPLFQKSVPIILASLSQYNLQEVVNIYWGYANARVYDDRLCTALEAYITKEHQKVPIEAAIQFFHALGIYSRNIAPQSSIDKFIRAKLESLNTINLSTQQQFALAYAFLLFENRSDYSTIWEGLINIILTNQAAFVQNPVYMNYLYQIYIHLRYSPTAILLPCMQHLLQLLIKHREVLIRFFKVNKRYFSSDLEKKIVGIIDAKVASAKNSSNNFVVQIKHDIPLVFYDDLRELESNALFPESELVIPYTMDSRKGALCFEVNGSSHYLVDESGNERLDGINLLKKRFMEQMGFHYIEIKNSEFASPELLKDEAAFTEKVMKIVKSQLPTEVTKANKSTPS